MLTFVHDIIFTCIQCTSSHLHTLSFHKLFIKYVFIYKQLLRTKLLQEAKYEGDCQIAISGIYVNFDVGLPSLLTIQKLNGTQNIIFIVSVFTKLYR